MARLIALQIRLPRHLLLNLSHDEILTTMGQLPRFYETHVVASAYGVGSHPVEWASAVFAHAVLKANFAFIEDFRKVMSLNESLCNDLARRFRALPQAKRAQCVPNMKRLLLDYVDDVNIRFAIASDLRFDDLCEALLSSTSGILLQK